MNINLIESLACISKIIDMINPRLNLHHVRTAYIAWHLARESQFTPAQCRKTLLAALLHDIGGLNEESRLQPLSYYDNELNNHAAVGAELLASVPLLNPLSPIVRYHHTRWDNGQGAMVNGSKVPKESHVIYLADRIDVLIARYRANDIISVKDEIINIIAGGDNLLYKPEYICAFRKIANCEHFWLKIKSTDFDDYIKDIPRIHNDSVSLHNFRDIAGMLAFIIDGFSQHGVQHSLVVGRISGYLAKEMGITPVQCLKIEIGGLLHNLTSLTCGSAPAHTGDENVVWDELYPIEAIRDIAGWCHTHKTVTARSAAPPEAMILRASIWLASLLQGVTLSSEFKARVGETAEIAPELAGVVQQHSTVLLQIFQESVKERRALVQRINQLSLT
ncbi:HD domain-containing protein [Citrobacter sedlakii]|uniref:HD domain-containing protein n=1 Tax=Citrobacter TaxID=544 RepID=UPI00196A0C02|nr:MULTISPECIES: HD domain-containing protein [Citrobacter]MBM9569366.1 HD domain-containing protein [Citrobacter sedlakii]MCZ4675943.1 HD domain-containing protein [Citrobacter sedlakii]MDR5005998.1 HD domain-containing protein [Citrobacter sedlakii]HBL4692441.1 HD domain-containing protein [Citrobacter sedlakii]HBL4706644.1 HD domain-containing protein [Citrobacter sedlakii]